MSSDSNKPFLTPRILAGALEVAAAVGIVFYFGYHLFLLYAPPPLVVLNPKHDIMTMDSSIPFSGITQKESHVFINEREILVMPDGAFSNTLPLQKGMNIIEITAVNKFGKKTTLIRRIIKQ